LAVGSTVVVAHYTGHGDTEKSNETAKQGLLSGVLITFVITISLFIFRKSVLGVLYGSAEPEVIAYANTYFSITIFSYPFIAISTIACGALRGAGDTKSPMQITLLMNLINIVLSYILIYGIDFSILNLQIYLPGYKVKGAAIGITIARLVGAALSLFVIIRGSGTLKLGSIHKLENLKINIEQQKYIFGVGIPASVESLLFQGGKLIVQIFIVGMGTISITANYVANSIFTLINIPGSALSIAATTLVGQSMGKNDKKEAESILIYLSIGIYKFPKKFLYWGLERGFPFPV
jgi:putative MATE family efflux protein